MEKTLSKLDDFCSGHSYRWRFLPVDSLKKIESDLKNYLQKGLINKELYDSYLNWFSFGPPAELPQAVSILILAIPSFTSKVHFQYNGQKVTSNIPPTYVGTREKYREAGRGILRLIAPENYKLAAGPLPLKVLAVSSGLGVYGRNNICYVPGMGSYHQLAAYWTDIPCGEAGQNPIVMESCQGCDICQDLCPTGAITAERFLLNAERCITYHNEKPGECDFPDEIELDWHNAVVGCMLCQEYCPENAKYRGMTEKEVFFTEAETRLLLQGTTEEELNAKLKEKLGQINLLRSLDRLPRNLGVLLNRWK